MTNTHSDSSQHSSPAAPEQMVTIAGVIVGSNRLLRIKDVQREIGLSRSTIYNMMADGTFPRARRIGLRCVGWPASEIEDWKNQRPLA